MKSSPITKILIFVLFVFVCDIIAWRCGLFDIDILNKKEKTEKRRNSLGLPPNHGHYDDNPDDYYYVDDEDNGVVQNMYDDDTDDDSPKMKIALPEE